MSPFAWAVLTLASCFLAWLGFKAFLEGDDDDD